MIFLFPTGLSFYVSEKKIVKRHLESFQRYKIESLDWTTLTLWFSCFFLFNNSMFDKFQLWDSKESILSKINHKEA